MFELILVLMIGWVLWGFIKLAVVASWGLLKLLGISPVHRCTGCWRGDLSAFAAAAGGCSLRVPCQSVSIRPKYAKSCFLGCFAYLAVVFSGLCI